MLAAGPVAERLGDDLAGLGASVRWTISSWHPELISHPAGQAAGILREHEPAAEIVRRMADEAATTIDRLAGRASPPA